jgi:hypothetical protein
MPAIEKAIEKGTGYFFLIYSGFSLRRKKEKSSLSPF